MSIHIDNILQTTLQHCIADASGPTLWIVDENISHEQLSAVRHDASLQCLTNRFDVAFSLRSSEFHVSLSDFLFDELGPKQFQHIVYRVSKERALVHHCLNESLRHLAIGGQLHIIGNKDDGINTHGKNAEKLFARKAGKHKHSTAYSFTISKSREISNETPWLDTKDYTVIRSCSVGEFEFLSKPGVYGWNKLDKGSVLLAREAMHAFANNTGSVLDLGCGYGYLLLATADLPFSARCATDNNVAAVHAAEANVKAAQIDAHVWLDDCAAHINDRFDVVLCNPPFHQGFDTSSAISQKFIKSIKRHLKSSGTALVVVNQFIALDKLAASEFDKVEVLCEEQGFKVLSLS